MSYTVSDYGEEKFDALLDDAYSCMETEWENDFLHTLSERYAEYGSELFLTDRIIEILHEICGTST